MCHTGSPVAWRRLEDDCGGLCRKWSHSGKVPSDLSLSAPSGQQPRCLMKSIISFLNQIAVSTAMAKERKAHACEDSKQTKSRNNELFRLERESDRPLRGMCLMKCRRSQCSHTHWGCQDIEPERPRKPPTAASETGCTNQPWAILSVCLCIRLCLRVLTVRMFMHLYLSAGMLHVIFWRKKVILRK